MGDWSNLERHVRLVRSERHTLSSKEAPLNDCRWPALRSQAKALFPTRWELQTFCHRTIGPRHLPRLGHVHPRMLNQPGKALHCSFVSGPCLDL